MQVVVVAAQVAVVAAVAALAAVLTLDKLVGVGLIAAVAVGGVIGGVIAGAVAPYALRPAQR